jgi:hypothetical protein
MSSVVQRTINASPQRVAGEVWAFIIDLIAPDAESPARRELKDIAGIAGPIIGSKYPESDPIVVHGNGPRVRIYCLYGETAATGDRAKESKLSSIPTENDWKLSLPCGEEDLNFFRNALKGKPSRFSIRKLGEAVSEDSDEDEKEESSAKASGFDPEAFLKL